MTESTSAQDLFKGGHFDQEIIILCVRWYITFKLRFRDLVQMMAERGITLSIRLFFGGCSSMSPSLKSAGVGTHGQSATRGAWMRLTSRSKASGSTSIAPWIKLHRHDPERFSGHPPRVGWARRGRTVDFLLSRRRDMAAAKRFFSRATKQQG